MTEPTETSSSNTNFVRTVPQFTSPEPGTAEKIVKLDTLIPEASTEPPIESFEHKKGYPYITEKYGISDLYQHMNLDNEVKTIDSYVLSQITKDSLQSTKKSYDSIVEKIEQEIGIDPNLDYAKRIEKLSAYINILKEQQRIEALKKEFNDSSNK